MENKEELLVPVEISAEELEKTLAKIRAKIPNRAELRANGYIGHGHAGKRRRGFFGAFGAKR